MRFRHILVPTDFSDGSEAAFSAALELAAGTGARLTLLHVHHVPATALPDMLFPMTPELMQSVEHSVELCLSQLVERARVAGVDACHRTLFGATHREICALAKDLDVDLIVIGTHGHTGLSHAILGSVAERVVRRAHCPVLTVRPKPRAAGDVAQSHA
jgi:nucleotide-binding universal stress UspA family protein